MPLDSRLLGNDGLLLCCNRYQEIILDSRELLYKKATATAGNAEEQAAFGLVCGTAGRTAATAVCFPGRTILPVSGKGARLRGSGGPRYYPAGWHDISESGRVYPWKR
jgi:hypothetical protein